MRRSAELKDVIERSSVFLLERMRRSGASGLIDTKFDISTGHDFDAASPAFKRPDCVYGWIQGRGLESLAVHAQRAANAGNDSLAAAFDEALLRAVERLETMRAAHKGRLFFAMSPDGAPMIEPHDEANFTDLFYAKGLFSAARRLHRKEWETGAEELFRFVLDAVTGRTFRSDQVMFDPRNAGGFSDGKFAQGPMMIALGGVTLFLAARPRENFWREMSRKIINLILEKHVAHGRFGLDDLDFIEALDAKGEPWHDGARILCDPGHTLEFTGLAAKGLLSMEDAVPEAGILPALALHAFRLGFQSTGGIIKSFDLCARCAVNDSMPWWSLPETIRAGILLSRLYPQWKGKLIPCVNLAVDALLDGYFARGTHGFACQTLNRRGELSPEIPAVPDADPCYHTNLSLIDCGL